MQRVWSLESKSNKWPTTEWPYSMDCLSFFTNWMDTSSRCVISLAHRGNSLCQSAWMSAAVHIIQVHPGSIRFNETNIAPLNSAKKMVPDILLKSLRQCTIVFYLCQQVKRGGGKRSREMCFSVCQVCVITRLQCLKGPQSYFESAYREAVRSVHSALLPGLLSMVSSHENACRSITEYLPLMWCLCEKSSQGQQPCSIVQFHEEKLYGL